MSYSINRSMQIKSLCNSTIALILAGGKGSRLFELTKSNSKPALEFGGKCKVIDFSLANCVNSGIKKIGVLTHYKPESVIRHITNNWGFLGQTNEQFIEILQSSRCSMTGSYEGTAHAVFQNIPFILKHNPEFVAILAADHVYKMDYRKMLSFHVQNGADVTISCIETPRHVAANRFGVMLVDKKYRVVSFQEKPANPPELGYKPGYTLASSGNYIFNTKFLLEQLTLDAKKAHSSHDFGHDIIPYAIKMGKVLACRHTDANSRLQPYWRDVGSIDEFWQANMDLLCEHPAINIDGNTWPILPCRIRAKLGCDAGAVNKQDLFDYILQKPRPKSVISSTAIINKSALAKDVNIGDDTILSETVVLPGVKIGRDVVIHKAIIGEGCDIPSETIIGIDHENDTARGFRISRQGVVLVTKQMLYRHCSAENEGGASRSITH